MSKELREAADTLLEELSKLDLSAVCDVSTMKAISKAYDDLEDALSQPEDKQEPFCYFAGDKYGKPVWSESCVSEDDIFCEDEYGEDVTHSIPLYTNPSNVRRISKDEATKLLRKSYEVAKKENLFFTDEKYWFVTAIMDACNVPPEAE